MAISTHALAPRDKVAVIGTGAFGSAVASQLASSGGDLNVSLYARDPSVASTISATGFHPDPKYADFPRYPVDLKVTSDLETALYGADAVILAVPSAAYPEVLAALVGSSSFVKQPTVVSLAKGLIFDDKNDSGALLPLQYLSQQLQYHQLRNVEFGAISGPGFARDLLHGEPTRLVATSHQEEVARRICSLCSRGALGLYYSNDPIGVEFGGAGKNPGAIAAGFVVGMSQQLEQSDPTLVPLLLNAILHENAQLAASLGAQERTLYGLAGAGDLLLTGTDLKSRNFRAGLGLAYGHTAESIKAQIGESVEGLRSAPFILALARMYNVDMPVLQTVTALLSGEIDTREAFKNLNTLAMGQRTGLESGLIPRKVLSVASGLFDGIETTKTFQAGMLVRLVAELDRLHAVLTPEERGQLGFLTEDKHHKIVPVSGDFSENYRAGLEVTQGSNLLTMRRKYQNLPRGLEAIPALSQFSQVHRLHTPILHSLSQIVSAEVSRGVAFCREAVYATARRRSELPKPEF